ncbi:hypothetical protein B0H14DRAFT_241213 [Mycena olivaceomarginata]|nr:hypothetical protein B0H14DRAFT_241213 [Mycena olivaceomarginata]
MFQVRTLFSLVWFIAHFFPVSAGSHHMCPLNATRRTSTRLRSFRATATRYSYRLGMPRTRHRDVHPSSPRPHPESEWNGDHVPLVSARLAPLLPRPRVTRAG